MIRSMTGYGRAEVAGPRMAVSAECKSVNHRSLDIAVRLPRALSSLEIEARRLVQQTVQRGRVEISVGLSAVPGATPTPLSVSLEQAREYAAVARLVADDLDLGEGPTLEWVLDQPGVVTRDEQPALAPEEGWTMLSEAIQGALGALVAHREREGKALGDEIGALLEALAAQVAIMTGRGPIALERASTRLRERMQVLLGDATVDEARLATEVAVWAGRTDITEELVRLRAHLDHFDRLAREGGAVGRTMDFLIQEMNREINTVGSKADDLELSQTVIGAKGTLEKLREQVQNIE
jgi:uncharacterized protein (TIGR00255 family)